LETYEILFSIMRDVSAYLAEQQTKTKGDIATTFSNLETLYNKKLWHQLTLELQEFVKNPYFDKGTGLIELYEHFLADFEHRINPLSLVEILMYVIKQIQDPNEASSFLDKLKDKVKASTEATVLCLTAIGTIFLRQKNLEETKKLVEDTDQLLETIDGVTSVHGRFYELSSNYHKLMGNHAEYYKDALRFLGCIDLKEIPVSDQLERAFNLALAALLGEGVYNFGELLAHPILDTLRNTEKQWLVDTLYAFNSGDLAKFQALKPQWQTQPDLAAQEIPLRQKISLLCLMEMTFKRPANNRQLSFEEISAETKLPLGEVELLVMKALSLQLVKGRIDQVDQKVQMTWVQPRVLDLQQIATMQMRLNQWITDVKSMEMLLESKAQDILTL
ncbi:unnamed protein product, partial [Owenia fusiformis]